MASCIISVSACQGQMALHVIPSFATSRATDFVNPITAALAAEYALLCAAPTTPATDAILMMRPDFARIMEGRTDFVQWYTPKTLISNICFQRSSFESTRLE